MILTGGWIGLIDGPNPFSDDEADWLDFIDELQLLPQASLTVQLALHRAREQLREIRNRRRGRNSPQWTPLVVETQLELPFCED